MRDKDFYIAGVSYAGHMVPNIATAIAKANDANEFGFPLRFKGIALGNPWINPYIQYGAYDEFALSNNLITREAANQIEMQVWWDAR